MSRGKSPFTDAQFDRAINLVHKHGYIMTGFKKDADGFTIMTRKPGKASGPNPWDEVLIDETQPKRPS